jgi:tight adherence protein B
MTLSAEPIVYGLIFIAVLVLVEGVYLVAFGKSISLNKRVNRRLEMLDKGSKRDEVLAKLRKEMDQHMSSRGLPLYSILADRAQKAAIAFTPQQLIMVMIGVSVVAFAGLTVGTEAGLAVRVVMGVAMGVGGVFFWISSKAKKRVSRDCAEFCA